MMRSNRKVMYFLWLVIFLPNSSCLSSDIFDIIFSLGLDICSCRDGLIVFSDVFFVTLPSSDFICFVDLFFISRLILVALFKVDSVFISVIICFFPPFLGGKGCGLMFSLSVRPPMMSPSFYMTTSSKTVL